MLAYYTTSFATCQALFEKNFDYFDLAPCNLSFSRVFARFYVTSEVAKAFFTVLRRFPRAWLAYADAASVRGTAFRPV